MKRCDYLIIGQGLAGTLLAWHLKASGRSVLLVDNQHRHSSSTVAAGLFNPLAGKRFSAPPYLQEWLDAAHHTYDALARDNGQTYFHPRDMFRVIHAEDQRPYLDKLLNDERRGSFIKPAATSSWSRLGTGIMQTGTGYLDISQLLKDMADRWLTDDTLIHQEFDAEQIDIHEGDVHYRGINASSVIFCEGWRAQHNPWFGSLPYRGARGEIIDIKTRHPVPTEILNAGHWLLPLDSHRCRVGSTYDRDTLDSGPTQSGLDSLREWIDKVLPNNPYRVTAHQSGVRPATADRLPLLGRHPEHSNLVICNGLGSRGSLTAPWYVKCLVDHLETGKPLPGEADIRRFDPRD
ncbi:MAG: NAD(P)/FAD-dependent oxidoreductase [bacterium]